jgi:hypothetical protein
MGECNFVSGPALYSKAAFQLPSYRLINNDSLPSVVDMTRFIAPVIGCNFTIKLLNVDPSFSIYFAGVRARVLMDVSQAPSAVDLSTPSAITAYAANPAAAARRRVAALQAASKTSPGLRSLNSGESLWIVELPVTDTGYAEITIVNAGGGRGSLRNRLFVTDDCPDPGYLGRGKACKPCPPGATCPGGNRIWPNPGYWSAGEFSGSVIACDPPAACEGGQGSACRKGHQGYSCSSCVDHYYLQNGLCYECPKGASQSLNLFALVTLWVAFALCVVFIRDRMTLSYIVMMVRALQMVGGIGSSSTGKLPKWLLSVYSVRLFYFLYFFFFSLLLLLKKKKKKKKKKIIMNNMMTPATFLLPRRFYRFLAVT